MPEKIIFKTKKEYEAACDNEKQAINECNAKIKELEAELARIKKEIKGLEKTPEISKDKKHEIVTLGEFEKYNYDKRRKEWHQKAGYNKDAVKCDVCKEHDKHATVQLENGNHLCYFCWIRKPTSKKSKTILN